MRKFLCIVLAFIIICTYATTIYAEELTDLQKQQEELQNQIEQSNDELNEVQSQLSENVKQIENASIVYIYKNETIQKKKYFRYKHTYNTSYSFEELDGIFQKMIDRAIGKKL